MSKEKEIKPLPDHFEETFTKFLTEDLPKINFAQENLDKGYPVSYRDDKNRHIKEYPNGKKYLLVWNEKLMKNEETEEITD